MAEQARAELHSQLEASNERLTREAREKQALQRELDAANTALPAVKAELAAERAAAGGASAVVTQEKLAHAQARLGLAHPRPRSQGLDHSSPNPQPYPRPSRNPQP